MGHNAGQTGFTMTHESDTNDIGRVFIGMVSCFEAVTPYGSNDILMVDREPQTAEHVKRTGVFFSTELRDLITINNHPRSAIAYFHDLHFDKTLPKGVGYIAAEYHPPEEGKPTVCGHIVLTYKHLEPQVFTILASYIAPKPHTDKARLLGLLSKVGFTRNDPEAEEVADALINSDEGVTVFRFVQYKEPAKNTRKSLFKRRSQIYAEEKGGRSGKTPRANAADGPIEFEE